MRRPWYADGVRFTCTQCGNCCTGTAGYVWVTKAERQAIAEFLGSPDGKLSREHVRRVGIRYSLTERANGDCVFLRHRDGKRVCGIYPARPRQCRTWPFWSHNLKSSERWEEAARDCPGMNRGAHHNFVAIEKVRISNKWEGAAGWWST